MSLTKKQFLKNSVWTFFELMLYPLLMIIATPVFIAKLGIEQYGLWMLVSTISLGMNILNIGVGDTNIKLIATHRASDDFVSIKKVFHFNFSLSVCLLLVAVIIGLLFREFNFISLFYRTGSGTLAGNILFLACCSAGLRFVEVAILSVFKAFERFDYYSKLMLFSKNIVMLANLVLVWLGYDLVTVFISTVTLNLVNIILQLAVLGSFKKGILALPSMVFLRGRLDHLNYHLWYWLQSAIALLGFLADKLIIAFLTDVKTLGYYSIATLIGSQIHNFFLSFGAFTFPRVSYKLAANLNIRPIYYIARSLVAIPGWLLISILLISGDVVFRLWLGAETYSHSIFYIRAYLAFEGAMLLIIVPYYFINATKYVSLNSWFELCLRSSHFLAMIAGYYLAGVNGILYGLITATLLNIPAQYFFFHRRVISDPSLSSFAVIIPVLFMIGLIFADGLLFQLPLMLGLIISCKYIYFDPARPYTGFLLSGTAFSKA